MPAFVSEIYEFGEFRLLAAERLLYRDGEIVPLTPKVGEILLVLVQAQGRIVSKEDLLREVWPDTFVEDHNLTQNIWALRKALGQTEDRVFIETLPKRGYRFVCDVTAPVPQPQDIIPSENVVPPRRPLLWVGFVFASVALLALGAMALRNRGARAMRQSIAVVGFNNLNRESGEWLSTALTEMFTTELAAGSGLRTVSSENVARLRSDLGLSDLKAFSRKNLDSFRADLGCDLVLVGSYLPMGGKIRLDVRLQDTATGEVTGAFTETADEKELLGLVSRAGGHLRGALGLAPVSQEQQTNVRAASPSNPQATQAYAEGLALLRRFEGTAAQAKLAEAVAADPQFPLAHQALSSAWSMLGYDQRARSEAAIAFNLAKALSREDRLLIEGMHWQTQANWPQAIDVYKALWKFYPDNIEYGLLLSSAEVSSGQATAARALLIDLRKIRTAAQDPRVDVADVLVSEALGDYKSGVVAAAKAIETAHTQGAQSIEARARLEEGKCQTHLADPLRARHDFEKAQEICAASGDQGCVADALNREASLSRSQGDLDGASEAYDQALKIERQNGDQRRRIVSELGLANVRRSRADMVGAQALFEQALETSREIGDQHNVAIALTNLGNVLNNSGHPDVARQRYRDALDVARTSGDRAQVSIAMNNLAVLSYTEGDLAGGKKQLEDVLEIKKQLGDQSSYAYSLIHLGNILQLQGDLAGARKAWQEQCRIQGSTGEKVVLANCELGLAELSMLEGHPESMEAAARKVTAAFKTVNPAADAWRLLAESYLKRNDLKQAKDASDHAIEFAAKTPNIADYKLPIAITAAKVEAALGHRASALASLKKSLAEAARLHLVALQFEARLAICEIEKDRSQILTLRQDSERMGFGLVAAQAARL